MADESGAKKVNPVLEKHWEKIVLGLVAVLALVFIGSEVTGGASKAVKGLESASANYRKHKDLSSGSIGAPPTDPEPRISPVQAPEPAGPFVIGTRTKFVFDIRDPKGPELAAFWLPKLTLNPPVPTFEGVRLSWTLSGEPPTEVERGAKGPIVVKPATFFFTIWRKGPGDNDWKELAKEVKGETFEYIDVGTVPKTSYQYRITLGSNDPQWTARNPQMLSRDPNQTSGPASVTTLGIWSFAFSNFQPGDRDAGPPPIPPQAYVTITKFDPEAGRVEWRRIHKEGMPLGFGEENGKLTSVHLVYSERKGRMVPVDFNSGGKLEKIEYEKLVKYEYKVCDPVVKDRMLTCEGPQKREDFAKVNVAHYTDEEGKKQTFESDSGTGRRQDSLCPEHGGAVARPPALPDDGPDRKRGDREEEAAKLLDEADTLWLSSKSGEKNQAVDLYRKLARSYADTETVKKRKEQISDRSSRKFD